jgi:hypothetical protein
MIPIVNGFLYILILLFGISSYAVGLKQMLDGVYSPSVFSRVVWLLIAINGFAAVAASHSSESSEILAAIFLIGNAAICITSFWKGTKKFGLLEIICLALLCASLAIWIIYRAPLVNLGIGLVAHLIGALPTYKRVLQKPQSESTGFWSLFFIASLLSIIAGWHEPIKLLIFPIYFTFFDGSMFALSMRSSKRAKSA